MTHDSEYTTRGGAVVTRRELLAGLLAIAATPTLLAEARAGDQGPPVAVSRRRPLKLLPREHHTTTETSIGTVVAGGYYLGALSAVHIYDGQTWHEGPPLLIARYQHTAVPYGNGVLVMGGLSRTGAPLSDAELFDGQAWHRLPRMRIPRNLAAAVIWNGSVMVTGGRYVAPLSSVEQFDGTTWQEVAPLSIPRFGHTAAADADAVVVRGGTYLAPLKVADSYNGQRWTLIPNPAR